MKIERNKRHQYTATEDDGTVIVKSVPGCTTILDNVLAKPALVVWSAREAGKAIGAGINEAIDRFEMGNLPEVMNVLRNLAKVDGYSYAQRLKDRAADRGTGAHTICETIARDWHLGFAAGTKDDTGADYSLEPLLQANTPLASDDIYLAALAFNDWLGRVKPTVRSIERMVVCPHCKYGATLDLELEIGGEEWIVDIKTSGGLYDSYALQLAAQRHGVEMVDAWTKEQGHHTILPRVPRRLGLLWISKDAKDGCELIETDNTSSTGLTWFALMQLQNWKKTVAWRLAKSGLEVAA